MLTQSWSPRVLTSPDGISLALCTTPRPAVFRPTLEYWNKIVHKLSKVTDSISSAYKRNILIQIPLFDTDDKRDWLYDDIIICVVISHFASKYLDLYIFIFYILYYIWIFCTYLGVYIFYKFLRLQVSRVLINDDAHVFLRQSGNFIVWLHLTNENPPWGWKYHFLLER